MKSWCMPACNRETLFADNGAAMLAAANNGPLIMLRHSQPDNLMIAGKRLPERGSHQQGRRTGAVKCLQDSAPAQFNGIPGFDDLKMSARRSIGGTGQGEGRHAGPSRYKNLQTLSSCTKR